MVRLIERIGRACLWLNGLARLAYTSYMPHQQMTIGFFDLGIRFKHVIIMRMMYNQI